MHDALNMKLKMTWKPQNVGDPPWSIHQGKLQAHSQASLEREAMPAADELAELPKAVGAQMLPPKPKMPDRAAPFVYLMVSFSLL